MSGLGKWLGSKKMDPPNENIHLPINVPAPFNAESLWWVKKARAELGVHEIHGGETQRILYYGTFTTLKPTEDEVPWCSCFMCFLFGGGTRSAAARSWATWGQHLDHFIPGCICVYSRAGGNHVNIGLEQRSDGSVRGIGGNQSDAVTDSLWKTRDSIIAFRWPPGEIIPSYP